MNRRLFSLVLPVAIGLSLATCGLHAQSAASDGQIILAGPFKVTAPLNWAATAYAEKIAAKPLYSEAAWKSFQQDPRYALKPGYATRPEHWAIRFPALILKGTTFDKKLAGDDETAPQILIHQTDGWASILDNEVPNAKNAAETRRQLRKHLTAMETGIPYSISPAFVDGGLSFLSLKKKLIFKGGHGYRMICQWDYEANLVRRGKLHYLFVGLSDDDSCQIIATFPLDGPHLPSEAPDAEHLGYSTKRYEELERNLQAYGTAAKKWIQEHEKDFTPSLEELDHLIESLTADTWR